MEKNKSKILVYDGYNQEIRKDSDTCGTITRNVGADLKRNGQGIIEYELSDKMKKYINSYDDKYKVSDGNLVVNRDCAVSKTTREGNTRADALDYISIDFPSNTNISGVDLSNCRVRKLTEKECGKLMGVLPIDCEKMAKNQSRSSQYHLYGDSIVTTVLMAWFGEILGVDWKSKVDEVVNELTGG